MFSKLSRPNQLKALRAAALSAAAQFGIKVKAIRLTNFGYNATYKVTDTMGRVWALRIAVNSKKSFEQVLAEIQFLALVSANTDLICPKPLATISGEPVAKVELDGSGSKHLVLAYEWLPGKVLGDNPTSRQLHALGATMANLHRLTDDWLPAEPARLPEVSDVFLGQPNHIFTGDLRVTKRALDLISQCLPLAEETFVHLHQRTQPKAIHADLHSGNAIWNTSELGILDFDDFGRGFELQDIAIAMFYLRRREDDGQPLIDGYQSVTALPQHTQAELESLIMSRSLMLLSDLLVNSTAEMQELLPTYIERTEKRLSNFLETGVFRLTT